MSQTFSDIHAGLSAVNYSAVAWGDYDNDSDLDILLAGKDVAGNPIAELYRNDNGVFQKVDAGLLGVFRGFLGWGDYDRDGDLDILLTGDQGTNRVFTKVYRNDGNAQFTDIQANLPRANFFRSVFWNDFDQDGDLDIIASGRFGESWEATRLYRHEGNDKFAFFDELPSHALNALAWEDIEKDGDLDLCIVGKGSQIKSDQKSRLYRNDGSGRFTSIATLVSYPISDPISVAWADYDNDGDWDVAQIGKNDSFQPSSYLLRNNGNLTFSNVNFDLPRLADGALTFGDYDNDGDLDLVLTGYSNSTREMAGLYRNNTTKANTKPNSPTGLSAIVERNTVLLKWLPSQDAETPSAGLTYNLRVGRQPGGIDVVSPMSEVATGYRLLPADGNVYQSTLWRLEAVPAGTYYWSVQAVDQAYAGSAFAQEQIFIITSSNLSPGITSQPDTVVYLDSLYVYQVAASDSDGDTLTFSLNTAAEFLTIEPRTGRITGTPGYKNVGNYKVDVYASDNRGRSTSQSYSLRVVNPNVLPPGLPNPIVSLKRGNKYVYRGSYHAHGGFSTTWNFYEEIIGDTLINNMQYFTVKSTDGHSDISPSKGAFQLDAPFYFFKRADSTKIYYYDPRYNNDIVIMDFAATINSDNPVFGYVFSKEPGKVFNEEQYLVRTSTLFGADYFLRTYSSKFGIIAYTRDGGGTGGGASLIGAIVDNVVYGDTATVTVVEEKTLAHAPDDFELNQNYPNPFNPSTTIQFFMPRSGFVTLKVYNTLGEEVATLASENFPAGIHKVEWNPRDMASGVYLYRLQAGDLVQTKKLVIVK